MSVNPASTYALTASAMASRSGPHGICSATSSGRTNWLAPSNPAGVGRSALTAQPPANQRNWSCALAIALSLSGSQQIGIWPILRELVFPFSASQALIRSASGSTATRWSARSANRETDFSPGHRDGDRHAALRSVPDPGRVDPEVVALPGGQLTGVQLADDAWPPRPASPAAGRPAASPRR